MIAAKTAIIIAQVAISLEVSCVGQVPNAYHLTKCSDENQRSLPEKLSASEIPAGPLPAVAGKSRIDPGRATTNQPNQKWRLRKVLENSWINGLFPWPCLSVPYRSRNEDGVRHHHSQPRSCHPCGVWVVPEHFVSLLDTGSGRGSPLCTAFCSRRRVNVINSHIHYD